MSWRIEHANPLTLLQELPGRLAQTCLLTPPRDLPASVLLDVLGEVHRVLRADGSLWVALPGRGAQRQLLQSINLEGWQPHQHNSSLAEQRAPHARGRVLLFSKQPSFLFHPPRVPAAAGARDAGRCWRPGSSRLGLGGCWRSSRRAWCLPTAGVLPCELVEWCIVASTTPRACGVCGAAWQRRPGASSGERWRAVCAHSNGRGRCLILDPFCHTGRTGLIAQRLGRSYLGVTRDAACAARARRRLRAIRLEPGR
jgi:hypothetical protein